METDLVIDELSSEPWGTLVVPATAELLGGPETTTSYFIKSKFSSASYTFLVTDLTSVWVQSCDRADVKRLKQEFNPLVDTPVARILLLVKQSLVDVAIGRREHSAQVKHQIDLQADGRLSVQFSTKIDFYRFKWTFDCAPLTGEEQRIAFLRTSFLQPLLVITSELQQQLRELKNIIALKDAEIAEYRSKGIKLPKAVQTARFDPEGFEDRRLASSSFKRTLREPTFSLDDVTGKIYQKLTAHHQDQEEKKVLSRQASCASLPLSTESASALTPSTFESSGSLSPGESKRKRMRPAAQPTVDVPSLSLSEASDEGPQSQQDWSSPSRRSPGPAREAVNPLSYQESPEETSRKVALRQRLEALAKKKEDKKQVKTTKRKFQFI
ncbi:uncharacterized protein ACA1_290740 [Acanthamoeba castellanii str. Neff]|uniref:Non-homologous end-joining factor 1 n=1 Tax=Acanthamoeba castellanii (strain ATCC 30010 / Neff) TaxID=1257118 RepID=L8HKU7_ACACF|nr:uncharacterized protein ACA1_290740 [Acanthamoeba castellanii str. Neff]ELR25298.1 hypothetical protein ACA1_290740 [Acanthamoeba castellanii str. Neff]